LHAHVYDLVCAGAKFCALFCFFVEYVNVTTDSLCSVILTDAWMGGQRDRETVCWADRQIYRLADMQTDRYG
jgi:hypothetical protein